MPAARPGALRLAPGALVATDFDGTLSPIVPDPASARPIDGAVRVLTELAARGHEVVVVSGRPLSFLQQHLPEDLTLIGLYGLEMRRHGEVVEHPNSGVWRETMSDVATAAGRQGPPGMLVELKGLSITLHYRTHPELAEQVDAYATDVAGRAGLRVRAARQSVELHPPIDEDKGTALLRLIDNTVVDNTVVDNTVVDNTVVDNTAVDDGAPESSVIYLGDDVGDLPAFDALDELSTTGRRVLRVAVDSDELSPTLRERADLVVDGPPGVLELLASFLD